MTKPLGRSKWTLEDFFRNLNLVNEGWDPWQDLDSCMLTHEEVKATFGKREQNGWKARPSELITHSNCVELQKIYELVYGHAPTNNDYPTIFFVVGW